MGGKIKQHDLAGDILIGVSPKLNPPSQRLDLFLDRDVKAGKYGLVQTTSPVGKLTVGFRLMLREYSRNILCEDSRGYIVSNKQGKYPQGKVPDVYRTCTTFQPI